MSEVLGDPLTSHEKAIADFCRRHHIRKLALFGSALRGELRPDSDIDLLVEFQPQHLPGFFRLSAMERELSAVLGAQVDMKTAEDLSRYFRDEVVRKARAIYAAD